MDLIKNWKLHLLALLIVIVAELIGMKRFDLIIFLPLFYALIIGGIISYPNFKILKLPEMERASRGHAHFGDQVGLGYRSEPGAIG